ncbi:MAG: ABC transporter ATP-binding protein [Chloroflexi bacterium]|nr:ABC transporter ATP-binding protein [Chloroflexota bacterium]MDA1270808.1 ABC transporter ATP-binding protein [Chloroflexota bacterium]
MVRSDRYPAQTPDSDNAIEIRGLTKFYGKAVGVEDLDLTVRRGEVFGFLGPNGAGKSTTIRLLLGFLRPTRGSARILGLDTQADSVALHRRVGYLAGDFVTYDDLTGGQVIDFIASLRGGVDRVYLQGLIERFNLDPSRKIRSLSKGNRQKVGVIQAIMNRPDVLILDEPTSGLDPLVQREFNRCIAEVKSEGRTVFVSSHILPEIEAICDRVGIIKDGHLTAVEEIAALTKKSVRRVELEFSSPVSPRVFDAVEGVLRATGHDGFVELTMAGAIGDVLSTASGYGLVNVLTHEPDLEEVFLEFYEKEEDHAA